MWHGSCFVARVRMLRVTGQLNCLFFTTLFGCVRQASAKGSRSISSPFDHLPPCHFHFLKVLSVGVDSMIRNQVSSPKELHCSLVRIKSFFRDDRGKLSNSFHFRKSVCLRVHGSSTVPVTSSWRLVLLVGR